MRYFVTATTLMVALVLPVAAWATPVPVTNFSFEAPDLPANSYQGDGTFSGPIPGWITVGTAGVQQFPSSAYGQPTPTSPLPPTGDGSQAVYVNNGYIYQDVGALLPNMAYVLTVAAGNQPGYGPGSTGTIALFNGADPSGTLEAQGIVAGQPVGSFTDFSTSFTTGSVVSGDLTIALAVDPNNPGGNAQLDFDNVRLDVPEPMTLALLGGAIVTGVGLRRRKRI